MRARLENARVFGSFGGYPNALAAYLVLVAGPMLGWLLTRARLWNPTFKWVLLGCVGVVMWWCFWLAGSRGGFVALTVVSIAGGMALAWAQEDSRKRLGLTLAGRLAAVTNYRDGPARTPAPRSRGELTSNYLRNGDEPDTYLERLAPHAKL